jgi:hypothetical protein
VKTIDIHVNARSGAVARDVLGTFLKGQLRDEASPPRKAGFVQYSAGIADEVVLRPFDKVAVQEVVSDERVLRTFLIHVVLYTADEAVTS